MKDRKIKLSFSIYASIVLFIILVITVTITGILMYLVSSLPFLSEHIDRNPTILILLTLISCTIIGTTISTITSRRMTKTIQTFMDASDHLAKGDFSQRLYLKNPPEFKILSENFNRMAEELEGIEILRSDFINNFSHEFKTPIVSIKGFAEILKYDDLNEEERNEYLDIIIDESSRLTTLAYNVLNLSKIESQMILTETQRYNVGEQIRQCVLLLHSKFEQSNLTLNIHVQDSDVIGNRELLSQVWLNLLDNAIKFTPKNGVIDISMQRQEEFFVFRFQDNGTGIHEDAIPKIFDKFYQQDHSHATAGNGLGLTIVKKIIELHKGTIICESAPMQGTCFIVMLPSSAMKSPD